MAQAETLLIYGIFLFLTGLAQIIVTISHQYIQLKSMNTNQPLQIHHFLPKSWALSEIHIWYIYPSAAVTVVPFVFCVTYVLVKRPMITFLICFSSVINFISSSTYVGLLIIHTLEYWQSVASYRYKSNLPRTSTVSNHLLISFDESVTFSNLALLITFTLALVQALLSMIGSVISCLWSPCCVSGWYDYTPITSQSIHVPVTPSNRIENPSVNNTIRTVQRATTPRESHRYTTVSNGQREPIYNGYHTKSPQLRHHYDDV